MIPSLTIQTIELIKVNDHYSSGWLFWLDWNWHRQALKASNISYATNTTIRLKLCQTQLTKMHFKTNKFDSFRRFHSNQTFLLSCVKHSFQEKTHIGTFACVFIFSIRQFFLGHLVSSYLLHLFQPFSEPRTALYQTHLYSIPAFQILPRKKNIFPFFSILKKGKRSRIPPPPRVAWPRRLFSLHGELEGGKSPQQFLKLFSNEKFLTKEGICPI